MRATILTACLASLSLPASAQEAAPLPREGSGVATTTGSSSLKAMPLGKDRAQVAYEFLAVMVAEDPGANPIAHDNAVRCIGSVGVLAAEIQGASGACVVTRPDGEQIFLVVTGMTGRAGAGPVKDTYQIVGGTGRLAGISGTLELTRYAVRPAAEGTMQTVGRGKMTYKLP